MEKATSLGWKSSLNVSDLSKEPIKGCHTSGNINLANQGSFEDEPQIAIWEEYVEESKGIGIFQTLRKYLVQFSFPIKEGISQTEDYRNATLRGRDPAHLPSATGLFLEEPDSG